MYQRNLNPCMRKVRKKIAGEEIFGSAAGEDRGGICRSAAPTAIVTSFLAAVTRLLNQVQHTAVFIYGLRVKREKKEREMAPRMKRRKGAPYPIAFARPHRLVSVRDAVETVRTAERNAVQARAKRCGWMQKSALRCNRKGTARGGGGGGIKNWALAITRASCSTKVHTRESEMRVCLFSLVGFAGIGKAGKQDFFGGEGGARIAYWSVVWHGHTSQCVSASGVSGCGRWGSANRESGQK
ncbi:hypothetical protein DFH94DRAFT_678807 [Russula ochroleuca]|uniref:Uncharacterized protein n=1 Tax=Russula ochroleuca TaxID=152965 RepID=A0A9P5N496_9AGAM|nr:hypothetical protein DFH94DRAFT_678807 [Russula ochroleuca]